MRKLLVMLFVVTLASPLAVAKDQTFEEIMNGIEGPLNVRVDEGVIYSIDLSDRTGIVGGHKYWFGPAFSEIPLTVKMYDFNGGSLELLQPGMKVEITYGDTGTARIAVKIRQLSDGASVDN